MTSLFDATDGPYLVLINDEEQRSLWPAGIPVPPGWRVELSDSDRQGCLDHIERHWTDMRPKSLRTAADTRRRR